MMITTLSRIKNLSIIEKDFFISQIKVLQNLIYGNSNSLSIEMGFSNQFKQQEQNLVKSDLQIELASKTLFFKDLITNSKLLEDPKF